MTLPTPIAGVVIIMVVPIVMITIVFVMMTTAFSITAMPTIVHKTTGRKDDRK